jgi:hypothetical protein
VHPKLNASIDTEGRQVTYHDAEHLGIAVDTERGLMVPVMHNAGDLNLGGLARKIADLAERTRNNTSPRTSWRRHVHADQHRQPGRAVRHPDHQPAAGRHPGHRHRWSSGPVVVDRPGLLGEVIAVRSMVYLALTYDHRLVDGADAARFLTTVKGPPRGRRPVRGRPRPQRSSEFVDSGAAFYYLHTHDDTGVIHIESPTSTEYTLGQFFAEWNQTLSSTQIGSELRCGDDLRQRRQVHRRPVVHQAHLARGRPARPGQVVGFQPYTFASGL